VKTALSAKLYHQGCWAAFGPKHMPFEPESEIPIHAQERHRSMRRTLIIGSLVFVFGSFLLAGPLAAQNRPHGLYAKINITSEINSHPNKTPAEFETYLIQLYQDMLINPAVSGLAIQAHWDQLNPNPRNIIM
jgi:hypothetical protein